MSRWSIVVSAVLASGCTSHQVPDPRGAADAFAAAAQRGDADAIYGMMTASAQKQRSRDEVR